MNYSTPLTPHDNLTTSRGSVPVFRGSGPPAYIVALSVCIMETTIRRVPTYCAPPPWKRLAALPTVGRVAAVSLPRLYRGHCEVERRHCT